MAVRDTSLLAYKEILKRLEPDEQKVFEILLELGPTHDQRILEALNQKEQATLKPKRKKRTWTINSVTGRRNGLLGKGAVTDLDTHRGYWHSAKKTYHIWRVTGDKREPIGWTPVPKEDLPKPAKKPVEVKAHIEQIRQKATGPILQKLKVSEAGRILAKQPRRNRKRTANQMGQLLFA